MVKVILDSFINSLDMFSCHKMSAQSIDIVRTLLLSLLTLTVSMTTLWNWLCRQRIRPIWAVVAILVGVGDMWRSMCPRGIEQGHEGWEAPPRFRFLIRLNGFCLHSRFWLTLIHFNNLILYSNWFIDRFDWG